MTTVLTSARELSAVKPLTLDSDEIRAMLPHRWPFLFLDRVTALVPGVSATGLKNVSISEPHFAGHFPVSSVMPGVLVIEALAQLAGVLLLVGSATADDDDRERPSGRMLLAGVSKFRFRQMIKPGDQLVLTVQLEKEAAGIVQVRAAATVGGSAVADGALQLAT